MPLGNLLHMDNILLENHRNTISVQAEVLPKLEECKDRDMDKPEWGSNTIPPQQATTIQDVLHELHDTNDLFAKFQRHAQQTCEFHGRANALPCAWQKQAMKLPTRHQPIF